ncbi:pentatricopeptide repeat-containing protein [Tanacetum coccineum]
MRCLLALNRHAHIITTQFIHNPKRFYSPHFSLKDATAITDALNLAANLRSLILGTQTHSHIIKLGLSNDVYTQNNSIKMYGSCGEFGNARKMFDEMRERNLVSWTLIISGANKSNEYEVGMGLFVDLMRNGCFAVNEFALGSVMKACVGMGAVEFGLCVHCFAVKIGLEGNVFVGSSILHMYCKNGEIEEAERLFAR